MLAVSYKILFYDRDVKYMTAIWDKIFRGYYYCDHLSNLLTLIQYGGIVGGNDNNYRSLKLRIEASSKFGWKS